MKSIAVIGLGMSPADLTQTQLQLIQQAEILIGGRRLLGFFPDHPALKKEISADIAGLIDFIQERMQKKTVVVLASGDPLFYGIGASLIDALGPEQVTIYPNVSTVAAAFAKIKEPWHDAACLSLHGRKRERTLREVLANQDKIALFTDPHHNPAWLAQFLLTQGRLDFKMYVLERLGSDSEKVGCFEPAIASQMVFSEPNLVILKRKAFPASAPALLQLGLPDQFYDHEAGLITKAEVRAITISKLRLSSEHILWDLGAGSGSVGIEAALFIRKGGIYAVEKNGQRIQQIENNKDRFKVANLHIVQADLPQGLERLPRPQRIFIGGGGQHLEDIIQSAAVCLKKQGIMVINTVILAHVTMALSTLQGLGMHPAVTQVQISRGRSMPGGERLEAQNPVWIISAQRA